jgi:RNA polymerase sigma-70 factor (ECF subfamily)
MYKPNKKSGTNKNSILQQKYLDFNSSVLPHFAALKNYALRITNYSEESEDLFQETMLRAFRFFDSFEKGTNIIGWLYRIMFNTFINEYRKKRKEPPKVDYENVNDFYESIKVEDVRTRHYENDAFNNVLNDEIVNALSVLPDDFRTIVFLSDIEGYSYKEIADFMGCLIGTVRSRLHRARKILYTLLYQYAHENGFIKSSELLPPEGR